MIFILIMQRSSLVTRCECQRTSPMRSQHWFRLWLGAVRQQAITWANIDLYLHCNMATLGQNWVSILTKTGKESRYILHLNRHSWDHYNDVIMGAIASQITSLTIVYSTVYSDADEKNNQSSASLAFVWGIHRWPVNSPHKWPVTRKMLPFDDVIVIGTRFLHATLNYRWFPLFILTL